MAGGGIYDQLGGGFHRYAVDAVWLVPHFEKMLYDNAQLAALYLEACRSTGEAASTGASSSETLDYVLREMTDPSGGFYSTQDADSEGEEGKFYVWTLDEIQSAPSSGSTPRSPSPYFGVREGGNFEGHRIPTMTGNA